jgi:carbonic anhydrase
MARLVPVRAPEDVLPQFRGTPIDDLLRYHDLDEPFREYASAELVVGMCMDHRTALRLPPNFAYVLRAGGANFARVEFKLSFAVAVGGVRAICLIGHTNCGMVGLRQRREAFVEGLVERAGWTRSDAEAHFDRNAPVFEIDDPADFVASEALRLRSRYPLVHVGALLYRVEDNLLYQLDV